MATVSVTHGNTEGPQLGRARAGVLGRVAGEQGWFGRGDPRCRRTDEKKKEGVLFPKPGPKQLKPDVFVSELI